MQINRTIVFLVLTGTASLAYADDDEMLDPPKGPPVGYFAAGGLVGKDKYDFHGFAAEAGSRLGETTPLFGRFLASAGNTSLPTGKGTFFEGRVGLEGRQCTASGMVCGSLGLDIGYHRGRFEPFVTDRPFKRAAVDDVVSPPSIDHIQEFDGLVAVPRLTLDGGGRVRARGVLELPQHLRESGPVRGIALSLALGVAF